jgi:hypothetical protein
MKLTKYLAGFAAFALISTAAQADVTVNITGATAYRSATLNAIKAQYLAATTPSFRFAHDIADGTSFNGSTRSIFIGNYPGVSGTTTIRCCFTGSVEGVRALAPGYTDPSPPTYYQTSLLDGVTASATGAELPAQGTTGVAALGGISDIAFSDVSKASTPFGAYPLQGGNCGVIVFVPVASNGSSITNVTSQQFRALLTKGFQPLSLFTGLATDTEKVFATGRNDGSGTRTTLLAETGYGYTKTVKQYVTNISSTDGLALDTIQLVPVGGVNVGSGLVGQSTKNASTIWGQNVAGNGGYDSGSTLRGDLAKTGLSVHVLDETGADAFGAPIKLTLLTWISAGDAVTSRNGGAYVCAFNGVRLNDFGNALKGGTYEKILSDADKGKIYNGSYTGWGYERLYRRNDATSGDIVTVYTDIKNALLVPANLGSAGLVIGDMHVSRSVDGGTVAP